MKLQSLTDCRFALKLCVNCVCVSEPKDMQLELPQTPKILQKLYSLCKCPNIRIFLFHSTLLTGDVKWTKIT